MVEIKILPSVDGAILGGGLGAMQAALALTETEPKAKIAIISKGPVGLSGSSLVSLSVHRFAPKEPGLNQSYKESFKASAQSIGDPNLLDILAEEGAAALDKLAKEGLSLEFKETTAKDGKSYRYLACCNPKYGRRLTEPLGKLVLNNTQIKEMSGYMAVDILEKDNVIQGVLLEKAGVLHVQPAKTVIIATGGGGYVYKNTSTTKDVTGDGYGLALRAGLELQDMEFVQFYPYRIAAPGKANIFPDVFDHGAVFLNEKGERFMEGYPKKELENRDILAREMYAQKEVIFDISGSDKEYLAKECTAVYELAKRHKTERFLMAPVAHFMMGGLTLREDTSTTIKGLFCCGEVTGGLHGANRIAGSALTECAVFGARAGQSAGKYLQLVTEADFEKQKTEEGEETGALAEISLEDELIVKAKEVARQYPVEGKDDPEEIVKLLRQIMWEKASLIRTQNTLEDAAEIVDELEEKLKSQRPSSLRLWLEARNMLMVADAIITSALLRKESRGAHYRQDYPRSDKMLAGNIMFGLKGASFVPRKANP